MSRFNRDPNSSKEALLGEQYLEDTESYIPARSKRQTVLNIVLSTVVLALVAVGSSLATLWATAPTRGCSIHQAVSKTSIYSPFFDDQDAKVELTRTTLNGSIYGKNILDTPWAQLTSNAETEAAWDALEFSPLKTFPISREQVLKMGKDPEKVAKFDDAFWHMGDDAYVGGLDLHHQIHCLNKIRKTILDGQTIDEGSASFHRMHVRHCIDTLMQHVLCTGDAGIITYNWYEGMDIPQPDFSVDQQCRNWESIAEWGDRRAVDVDQYAEWIRHHKPSERVELQTWSESHPDSAGALPSADLEKRTVEPDGTEYPKGVYRLARTDASTAPVDERNVEYPKGIYRVAGPNEERNVEYPKGIYRVAGGNEERNVEYPKGIYRVAGPNEERNVEYPKGIYRVAGPNEERNVEYPKGIYRVAGTNEERNVEYPKGIYRVAGGNEERNVEYPKGIYRVAGPNEERNVEYPKGIYRVAGTNEERNVEYPKGVYRLTRTDASVAPDAAESVGPEYPKGIYRLADPARRAEEGVTPEYPPGTYNLGEPGRRSTEYPPGTYNLGDPIERRSTEYPPGTYNLGEPGRRSTEYPPGTYNLGDPIERRSTEYPPGTYNLGDPGRRSTEYPPGTYNLGDPIEG